MYLGDRHVRDATTKLAQPNWQDEVSVEPELQLLEKESALEVCQLPEIMSRKHVYLGGLLFD